MRTDRRTFLKRGGGAIACTVLGHTPQVWATANDSAELALKNGAIVTMSDKQPLAEAMAVRGGRILAVGSNQQIEGLISKETKVVDLSGKCVSPGLIDAHSHVIGFGQMQLKFVLLRPPKVNSFEALNKELAGGRQEETARRMDRGPGV
jgi:hypothetical protein